jgi:DNA ligase 1
LRNGINKDLMQPKLSKIDDFISKPLSEFIVEIKYDGIFLRAVKKGNKVQYWTRNSKIESDRLPIITKDLLEIPGDFMVEGELVGNSFSDIHSQFKSKDAIKGSFFVFDALEYNEYNLRNYILLERKRFLANFFEKYYPNIVLGLRMPSFWHLEDYFDRIILNGGEGLVIKSINKKYIPGRSDATLKIKKKETSDLRIVSIEKKYEKFIYSLEGEGRKVKTVAYEEYPIGSVLEIGYLEKTKNSFRNATIIRQRPDKEV